jgi:hypothetical protein
VRRLDVRIDKLRVTEDEIKEYTRELEIIRDRIYQVKRQVDTMSLGSYGISDQLEKIIGNTIQTSVIMRKYYKVLDEATKEYETTENKIIEKYTGIHKNKENVKEKKEEKKAKKKKSFWENAGDSIGGFFVGVGKGIGNFAKGVAYDVESFVHDPSDYVDRTKKQVVLGNFTEETTVMGTIIQIGAGVVGVDLPADVRDLSADVMNWEWSKSHIKQTLLDGISLLPIAGGFKSGDEVADIVKNGSKSADKIDDVLDEAKDVGEDIIKGSHSSGKVWDYSKQFDGELSNFNDGYQIKNVVDKDLYLVQFHSNANVGSGRSLKYWTTFDEANGISTIDDYMDKMALMSNWGARDNVSIAKIPAGTKVKYAIGSAREQVGAIESRPGGGLQILFEQFDDGWILDTQLIP